MARAVQFQTESKWYVPDIGDNRADPDPFAVLISPMSGRDAADLERVLRKDVVAEAETDIESRFMRLQERIVAERVLEVRGYETRNVDTGAVTKPTNGAELVAAILGGPATERQVLLDITLAVQGHSRIKEGLLGKSPSRSALPQAATAQPGPGAVPGAAVTTSPVSATKIAGSPETATASTARSLSSGHQSLSVAPGVS